MLGLNTRLGTIGISAAKGVDLVMQREQIGGTLSAPTQPSRAQESRTEANSAETKKPAARTQQLTAEQQRQIEELKQIDRKVREHERAHISVGGELIQGGASYAYTYGPDGKQYATSGEVSIDTSAEKAPEANIDKGQRIRATALAPSDPSPQDHRVAAIGTQIEEQGRSDLVRAQREEAAATQSREPVRERLEKAYGAAGRDTSSRFSVFA